MKNEKRGYSLKVEKRTHPFKYEPGSRSYEEGAHKHWRGCYTREGGLNSLGLTRLRNDRQALEFGREMRYANQ